MKTTETIKEQRQRREARRKMLCDTQCRDSAIEAENALQAVRDNLLCIKKNGSVKPIQLYKPKDGLEVITPDWGFIQKRQCEGGVFLYEGKRVFVTETSLSYGIAEEFTGGFAEFEFVDGIKDRFHIRSIPNGLIYCKEYELV